MVGTPTDELSMDSTTCSSRLFMKSPIVLFLLTITPTLYAQQQVNIALGGVVSMSFSSGNDRSGFGALLNPKVARYFRDHNALGLGFAYSFHHSDDVGFESTDHSLLVYPFYRKVVPGDENKGVFIEIGPTMGFDYRKTQSQGSTFTDKSVFAGAWARPGLYYFITDGFAAECMIGVLEYRLTAEIQPFSYSCERFLDSSLTFHSTDARSQCAQARACSCRLTKNVTPNSFRDISYVQLHVWRNGQSEISSCPLRSL